MTQQSDPSLEAPRTSRWEEVWPGLGVVLTAFQTRFASDLVGVILYGSHARGEAKSGSDIDLLVVTSNLPSDWRDVFALEDELTRVGDERGWRLDVRLVEPEAVSYSVTWAAPLMLEVYASHCILFDPTGFVTAEMDRLAGIMRERGIYRIAPGVWRLPAVAHE